MQVRRQASRQASRQTSNQALRGPLVGAMPFRGLLETREPDLSFGTKINGMYLLKYVDISFYSFDQSSMSPTVQGIYFWTPCMSATS